MRLRRETERGSSLVETGLIALPLILMLLGAMEGGRYVFIFNQINDAARNGAHYAIKNFDVVANGSDSGVLTAARAMTDTNTGNAMSCNTQKTTSGLDQYVDVTCSVTFNPVVNSLPFQGTISARSRMYVY